MFDPESISTASYVVYQDLNDATNIFVARVDEIVTGTFRAVAGPFDDLADAETAVAQLRRTAR